MPRLITRAILQHDVERTLGPGDDFEVAAGTPHRETVGASGARILSGRFAATG